MNALFLVGIKSRTKSLKRSLCRKIVLLSVVTAAQGGPAMANFKDFSVNSQACDCAGISVTGCIHVSSIAISYDLVVDGATNGDILEAKVVAAVSPDPPNDCTADVGLFALEKVGLATDPGHLRGAFFLSSSSGTCSVTDPDACITSLQGLVTLTLGARSTNGPVADCIKKIIKDNIPPLCPAAPAVSEWGFVAMIALVMIAGTIVFRRRAIAS